MKHLDNNEADITTLDPGNVFIGGRYHSLLPIMKEVFVNQQEFYYSVAVVKRFQLPEMQKLGDLRGKRACFPGVGIHGGYIKTNLLKKFFYSTSNLQLGAAHLHLDANEGTGHC